MKSVDQFKKAAGRVEDYLLAAGIKIKHTQALEVVARAEGAKSWNVLQHNAEASGAAEAPLYDPREVLEQVMQEAWQNGKIGSVDKRAEAIRSALAKQEGLIGSSATCVNVEYDPTFYGGDYSAVGSFVAVPLALIQLAGNLEYAFEILTGLTNRNIVHYSFDELVNPEGEPLAEANGDKPEDCGIPAADAGRPLMWLGQDRPLTKDELDQHTKMGEYYVHVVVDVDWDLLGDTDALNDEVSERITGSSGDLQDIRYENYFPTDAERQQYGNPGKREVWIHVHAAWDPMD